MHRIVVDVQTGEVTQVPLTPEEQAAFDAAQAQSEPVVETEVDSTPAPTEGAA
jgi:hypothetical protein